MKANKLAYVLLSAVVLGGNTVGAASTNKSTAASKPTSNQNIVHTLNNLPSVKLTSRSSMRLTDVNVLTQNDINVLTYTLTITNGDNTSLNLLDYWTKVRTTSGTVYSAVLISGDKEKKSVAPGSSLTLTYVVKIAKHLKPSDLAFEVVKWDFSKPNYENKLGQFKIPASYMVSTPAHYSKTLRINETPVKLKVNQVTSFLSGDYNYVGIDLNVQNIGYKLFEDPKLKFVIKTSSGSNYPLTLDSSSADYKIQPQDNKILKLMASIPKSVVLKNLELQIIQDDETTKSSLPISTLQLGAAKNQSVAVKPYTEKLIAVGDGKLAASVTGAWSNQSYGESDLSVQLSFSNKGNQTITVPKYEFVLHSSNGYSVPVSTTALDNLTLGPQEQKSIKLNITLKTDVARQNLQLFVNAPKQAASDPNGTTPSNPGFSYPIGIFALPEAAQMQNTLGKEQFMQTNNGSVGLTLSSIQRLPWSDGNLVSAKVTIENLSNKTMALPELSGQYKVDSVNLDTDVKLINMNNTKLLGTGMSTDLYIVTKLPAYLDITQLQIALMEKIGEGSSEWFRFTNLGSLPELPSIEKGSAYELKDSGHNQRIKELKSMVYSGSSSDILYTELEVKNLENHQIDLSQLVGYYQSVGGQIYQANTIQADTAVPSQESGLVILWSKLPKAQSINDLKLIIGEGIADNKLTPIKGESTGYINAASMALDVKQPGVSGWLTEMNITPYTLGISNVNAYLNGSSSVRVNLNYNLQRNQSYLTGEFNHKYVIELHDYNGHIFEKEISPDSDLKPGNGSFSFSIDDPIFEKMTSGSYILTVYDRFQGANAKLASQVLYYNTSLLVEDKEEQKP
ncbi:hypothetical protein [Paenibacillus caui]|uniref:hypothetical protein n=1 Tax=Paenibacillus caui TaxID=2873927 RepID=UPI001CA87B7B|nr:hypothetical protein [Paenibacillus caui]